MPKTATIVVFEDYSMCSECRYGADPREPGHLTRVAGYRSPGCGAVFTAIAMGGIYGEDKYEAIQEIHPELPFVEWYP